MIRTIITMIRSLFGFKRPEAAFSGEIKLNIESCTIKATTRKLKSDWTVEIDNEWPVYRRPENMPGYLTGSSLYDDRYWPRSYEGTPRYHAPLTDQAPVGVAVIWKSAPFDYL